LITLLGGAAVWPLAARAQQAAMPVIGVLDARSPGTTENSLRAFREGLKDTGYIAGENLALEYRWAEDQIDRLPALAADLVQRRATVIAAIGPTAALAAKAAIATIPIVFIVNEDPVRLGLVASLARPGGNLTGINILTAEVTAKRLDLLRELMPSATRVGVLVNPVNATNTETTLREMAAAARTTGLQVKVLNPAPAGRSMRPSQVFCTSGRTPSSLAPSLISTAGGFNSPCWRHLTGSPRSIHSVTLS
jgi:putative ABC transport system substrate-binding protein